jgi:hypothetical protein
MRKVGQATSVGQEESPLRSSKRNGPCVASVPPEGEHKSQGVLADVGECSMATDARKREGGQLAKKSLRGLMRRRRRRISRSNPLPPLSPVSLCRFAGLLCKNPLQMTTFVLCYGQPAHAQSLARVGQTGAVGPAGMVLGEVACDVPMGRRSGLRRARARARGRSMCRGDRNAYASCTNYFPPPYCNSLAFANAAHLQ